MANNILKKTLLSSALGLMLGFQGMQDAAATTVSYVESNIYGPDYFVSSGNVELSFDLISYGAIASANGVTDPGSYHESFFGFGNVAEVGDYFTDPASSYAISNSEGFEPFYDYVFSEAATDSSLGADLTGEASAASFLTYSFTAMGTGILDLFAPYEYYLDVTTGAGDCGYAESTGLMSVALNGGEASSGPHAHSMGSCNGSDYPIAYGYEDLALTLSLEDGATGTITILTTAFASYFPDVVALPLPASSGMLLLGLLMLLALRRRNNGNLTGTAA